MPLAKPKYCSWLTGLGLEIYWIDWQAQSFELQMPSPDCLTGPSYHHRHHIRKYYHIIISNLVLETDLNICQGLDQSSSSSSSPSPTSRSHLEGVKAGGGEAAEVESCFCCCTQLRPVCQNMELCQNIIGAAKGSFLICCWWWALLTYSPQARVTNCKGSMQRIGRWT